MNIKAMNVTMTSYKIFENAYKNLMFAIKAGLAGTAVYYIGKEGVWRESSESLKVYDRLNEVFGPYVKQVTAQIPIEIPPLPEANQVSYVTKQYWNQGVITTFTFLSDLPDHVKVWSRKSIDSLMEIPEIRKMVESLKNPQSEINKELKK